ncbi:hypothetical protein DBR06_SOUSAS1010133, partial [Sousa chinensis]
HGPGLPLSCIHSPLTPHDDDMTVTELGKINALVKADGVQVGPSWSGSPANALTKVNIRRLICSWG